MIERVECMPSVVLELIANERWRVLYPLTMVVRVDLQWITAEIEAGFESDLDSIPRIPFIYDWLKGRTRSAALFHDCMYQKQVNRELADNAFLRAMTLEGVKHRYRYPIYWAVRLFGASKYETIANAVPA